MADAPNSALSTQHSALSTRSMSDSLTIGGVEWEPIIGLEVHVQLLTDSKMFCGCSARYAGAPPNTLVCPVCLGLPGSLPVINRRAVEFTILTGLALNCQIEELTKFDRKNYPYPDIMKGYQISQYDLPLCRRGWLEIDAVAGAQGRDATRAGADPSGADPRRVPRPR